MKAQHLNTNRQHSRRPAGARVLSCEAFVAASQDVVAMLGTLTAKINPRWVPGGLPMKGNP